MFQFSLRNLLIAVAGCAFGAAALVNANVWWVAITWSAALLGVTAAALLAIHRREEKRAFWSGFAFFGSLYLLLLMYSIQPVSSSNSSVLCLEPLSYHNLLTTKLTTWSYSRLPAALATEFLPGPGTGGSSWSGGNFGQMSGGVPPGGMPGMSGMPGMGSSGMGMPGGMPPPMSGSGMMPGGGMGGVIPPTPNPRFVDQKTFTEVGHALWTVLLAFLGGTLAGWLHKSRQQPAA